MGYTQLTQRERYLIEQGIQEGLSDAEIGRQLGRHRSTIGRERRRNGSLHYRRPRYEAEKAIASCQSRRRRQRWWERHSGMRRKVSSLIRNEWSPEQISGRFRSRGQDMVCHESIYQYIDHDRKNKGTLWHHLRWSQKRRRRRRGDMRWGPVSRRVPISERPEEANLRQRIGDWEGDTVELRDSGGFLLTLVDRKSRYLLLGHMKQNNSTMVTDMAVRKLRCSRMNVETITFDNGAEFACHGRIARKTGGKIFFATPYHPWERGTNENTNGLIRQYLPKKTKPLLVGELPLGKIQTRLNSRPRKCLGWRTPAEIMYGKEMFDG